MRKKAACLLILAAAGVPFSPATAQDGTGPFTGFIDVTKGSPYQFFAGEERKFHPGEHLTITLQGNITLHTTRPERRCAVGPLFCKTVNVPNPRNFGLLDWPVEISWNASGGGNGPGPRILNSGNATIDIGLNDAGRFDAALKLVGYIPQYPRRGESTGGYDIRVTLDNTVRRDLFADYLRERARTAIELRSSDVLDSRLRARYAPFLARQVFDHATYYYGRGKPNRGEYPNLVRLAIELDPTQADFLSGLAQYSLDSGDTEGAQKAARDALAAAKTPGDRSVAYVLLGDIAMEDRAGLGSQSVPEAASFYAEGVKEAGDSPLRDLLISALLKQADALMRMRSEPSMKAAGLLYGRAKALLPLQVGGAIAAVSKDERYALVSATIAGTMVSLPEGNVSFRAGQRPLGVVSKDRFLVIDYSGTISWASLTDASTLQRLGTTARRASRTTIGAYGLVLEDNHGDAFLIDRDQRERAIEGRHATIAASADLIAVKRGAVSIVLERASDGKPLARFEARNVAAIQCLALSADGKQLAAGAMIDPRTKEESESLDIKVWLPALKKVQYTTLVWNTNDPSTYQQLRDARGNAVGPYGCENIPGPKLAYLPSGELVVITAAGELAVFRPGEAVAKSTTSIPLRSSDMMGLFGRDFVLRIVRDNLLIVSHVSPKEGKDAKLFDVTSDTFDEFPTGNVALAAVPTMAVVNDRLIPLAYVARETLRLIDLRTGEDVNIVTWAPPRTGSKAITLAKGNSYAAIPVDGQTIAVVDLKSGSQSTVAVKTRSDSQTVPILPGERDNEWFAIDYSTFRAFSSRVFVGATEDVKATFEFPPLPDEVTRAITPGGICYVEPKPHDFIADEAKKLIPLYHGWVSVRQGIIPQVWSETPKLLPMLDEAAKVKSVPMTLPFIDLSERPAVAAQLSVPSCSEVLALRTRPPYAAIVQNLEQSADPSAIFFVNRKGAQRVPIQAERAQAVFAEGGNAAVIKYLSRKEWKFAVLPISEGVAGPPRICTSCPAAIPDFLGDERLRFDNKVGLLAVNTGQEIKIVDLMNDRVLLAMKASNRTSITAVTPDVLLLNDNGQIALHPVRTLRK